MVLSDLNSQSMLCFGDPEAWPCCMDLESQEINRKRWAEIENDSLPKAKVEIPCQVFEPF